MLETVLKRDRDLGTPESLSTETVTLTIDGQTVTVPAGTSIMRAAAETGIQIPKLCASDNLEAFGSCRLCLVEIEARRATRRPAPPPSSTAWWSAPKPASCTNCGAT